VETTRTAAELDWFGRVQLPALVRQVEADALGPNPLHRWCGWCPAAWRWRCMPWRRSAGDPVTGRRARLTIPRRSERYGVPGSV
jgi:hypothetical protein